MHPLDVTHKALMTRAWIDSLRTLGTRTGAAAAAMLDFYERFEMERYGAEGGPLHDPCVIAYLLQPGLFAGKDCSIEIKTASPLTPGTNGRETCRERECQYEECPGVAQY